MYIELFVDNLDDEDAAVRSAAAVPAPQEAEHVPLLIGAATRRSLCGSGGPALQRIHSPVAVRPLIDKLDEEAEESTEVRAACCTLGQYAEPRVLAAACGPLRDQSLAVNIAEEALMYLTGQNFGLDQRAWIEYIDGTGDPFEGHRVRVPAFRADRWIEYVPRCLRHPTSRRLSRSGCRAKSDKRHRRTLVAFRVGRAEPGAGTSNAQWACAGGHVRIKETARTGNRCGWTETGRRPGASSSATEALVRIEMAGLSRWMSRARRVGWCGCDRATSGGVVEKLGERVSKSP